MVSGRRQRLAQRRASDRHLQLGGGHALNFPSLFHDADAGADRAQREYLWLVRLEYILLLAAAVLSLQYLDRSAYRAYWAVLLALVFFLALAVMLYRSLKKPEQDWYRCRALAESVKTSTWRYATRADPFETASSNEARIAFCEHLEGILESNRAVAHRMTGSAPCAAQITPLMDEVRALPLPERKAYYLEQRVADQRLWYAAKAAANRTWRRRWVCAGVGVYVLAGVLVIVGIGSPAWLPYPVNEPLIVLASSIVGWMQVKKYAELAASYALAAHEIGIVDLRGQQVESDEAFSRFVNDAELAFSREHTQWAARQRHA